jgi:hypothetical protein
MGVKLQAASGGSVELVPTNTASNFTLTVPARTGNLCIDGPAFSAYQSSSQTLSSSTATKIQLQTEEFDTNSNFDNSTNYRFTPTVAGYYQVIGSVQSGATNSTVQPFIYKNGSVWKSGVFGNNSAAFVTAQINVVLFLNGSTDYVELYASLSVGQALVSGATNGTYFSASMVRAA